MDTRRGDIFYANLSPVVGSEQGGKRPVLILQNNTGNRHSPTVIIAPITTKEKHFLPTHVRIPKQIRGLPKNSTVLLEQIRTIDKSRLRGKGIPLNRETMGLIDKAIELAIGK